MQNAASARRQRSATYADPGTVADLAEPAEERPAGKRSVIWDHLGFVWGRAGGRSVDHPRRARRAARNGCGSCSDGRSRRCRAAGRSARPPVATLGRAQRRPACFGAGIGGSRRSRRVGEEGTPARRDARRGVEVVSRRRRTGRGAVTAGAPPLTACDAPARRALDARRGRDSACPLGDRGAGAPRTSTGGRRDTFELRK